MFELESDEFREYLQDLGKAEKPYRHKFYDESVEISKSMGVHLSGDDPEKLLSIKRPNESADAKQYRLDSYKPKTKSSGKRAVSIINRIYNDRLFSIDFVDNKRVPEDFTLEKYIDGEMPYYKTLLTYIKTVFTHMNMKDPGGVVIIQPTDFEKPDTELPEPIPMFYSSKQVLDFQDEKYFTIGFFKKNSDYDKDEFIYKIAIYQENDISVYKRKKPGEKFEQTFYYVHNFDWVPGFRSGGVVRNPEPPILYESYIDGVLPHWDDALCHYSDLSAQIVNHLYPEKWEYSRKCTAKGCIDGKVSRFETGTNKKIDIDCHECQGTGRRVVRSPFNVIQINRNAMNPDEQLPIPPGGYITKDLQPTEMLEKIAQREIEKGFEAINLDMPKNIDQNQSGIAKMIDRQDQDGFLATYASHVFNYVLPNIIEGIIRWRYSAYVSDPEDYMPLLKEPTSFDIYSISLLTDELSTLKTAGVSGSVLIGLQKDIIEKRFPDKGVKMFLKTILDVDPLGSLSDDQIMASGSVISRPELYIHTYAKSLVEEAMETDIDFLFKPLGEKKKIIYDLALSKESQIPIEIESTQDE